MMRRRGPGLIRMAGRTAVVAGTATVVAGSVSHRQQERYAREDAAQYPQQQYAPPQEAVSAEPPEPAYAGQLRSLAQLKADGIISSSEYEAKKKQLLGI